MPLLKLNNFSRSIIEVFGSSTELVDRSSLKKIEAGNCIKETSSTDLYDTSSTFILQMSVHLILEINLIECVLILISVLYNLYVTLNKLHHIREARNIFNRIIQNGTHVMLGDFRVSRIRANSRALELDVRRCRQQTTLLTGGSHY